MITYPLHIHYTDGPDVLKDVSKEITDEIIVCLREGYSDQELREHVDCTQGVIDEVRNMTRQGLHRCAFCGAYFEKHSPKRITCYKEKHFLPCIDCGKPVEIKESYTNYMKAGGRRCQTCRGNQIGKTRREKPQEEKDAIVAKQEATMLKKYGARNAQQVKEIHERTQQTVKEKYGVDNLSQSAEIQNRIKENSQKRFGVDHYSADPEIRKRMIEGMIAKYGYASPQQVPELIEKTKTTNMERYGAPNPLQNPDVVKKGIQTNLAKYGVEWSHQRPDIIERAKQTNLEKYGAVMYPLSDAYMRQFISDPSRFDNYKKFMSDPEEYIKENYKEKPTVRQLVEDLGVTDTTIYDKLIAINKKDIVARSAFTMETQLVEFLLQIGIERDEIEDHNRIILEGKEIDVYLPNYHIGIECNPTYTHNSTFAHHKGDPPKPYRYHQDKSFLAAKKGVFLYHIFGYEWANKRDLIKSQLRNLLGKNEFRIYGRNTQVKEITYAEAGAFLNENHRQGSSTSSVRLGLVDKEGKLVSVMTFGKVRKGIGMKKDESADDWELVRFCNLRNTSVVGGASKLFKHFLKAYKPQKVISFSDIAHTRGTLYELLGFENISTSAPGYVWAHIHNESYYNRVTCQKSNLPNLFNDVTEATIQEYTEKEIMMTHSYAQVFDSGVIRWEYTKV